MEIAPLLRSTRFEQLGPGDLFILHRTPGSYVALAVKDPKAAKDPNARDKMVLVFGPPSSAVKAPILMSISQQTPVVSFGTAYELRLPCDTNRWLAAEPDEGHCLVLAEDKVYMRAQFAGTDKQIYVEVRAGLLLTDSYARFAYPSGECAYTLTWAFLTAEKDAREILSSPRIQ
jgi:hypothetical protein